MRAATFLNLPPVRWEKAADRMSEDERQTLSRQLDGLACRAAECAGYLDLRSGHGCGDQGHKAAVKRANRNGRMVWTKVLGYNAHHGLAI